MEYGQAWIVDMYQTIWKNGPCISTGFQIFTKKDTAERYCLPNNSLEKMTNTYVRGPRPVVVTDEDLWVRHLGSGESPVACFYERDRGKGYYEGVLKNPGVADVYQGLKLSARYKEEVNRRVQGEIEYQIEKHGASKQHRNDFGAWIVLIDAKVEEMKRAYATSSDNHAALHELRKVLALATVAAIDYGIPSRKPK